MGKRTALAMVLSMLIWGTSDAGWLEDAVKGTLGGAGKRAVDDAADSAQQGAKGKGKESVQKEGEPGQDADAEAPAQQKPAAQKTGAGTVAGKPGDAGGGQDIAAAEQIYSKYDFVPGEKVIFFDDFSDTDVGEFPRKWTLQGPGAGTSNAVEVVQSQGRNFLRSQPAASTCG
jgi:OOP family OmpA-OmpF porin